MTDYRYKSLINQLSIEEINPSTLKIAKSLHLTIFPVLYPDTFYEEFLIKSNKKCYLIKSIEYIGTISVIFHSDYVYLMTFGLLKEYRRMKIGGYCLLLFEKFIISKNIFQIFLHVQVVNKIACNFYKKNGYVKIKVEENYYESLSNKQAYLFYKQIYKENVNDYE